MRIFIIDDNKILADKLKEAIENYNKKWKVYVFYDGKQALLSIPTNMPDVVFIDILLRDMSGLDLLKEIKEIEKDIQAIIMTAHASLSSAIKSLQYGALDYIQKPVRTQQIIKVLNSAIEKRKLLLDTRKAVAILLNTKEKEFVNKMSIFERMMILRQFQMALAELNNESALFKESREEFMKIFKTDKILIFKKIAENSFILYKGIKQKCNKTDEIIENGKIIMEHDIGGFLDNGKKIIIVISFEQIKWGFIYIEREIPYEQEYLELAHMFAIEIALKIKQFKLSKNIDSKMLGLVFVLATVVGMKDAKLKKKIEMISSLSAEFAEYLGMDLEAVERIRYNALMYNLLNKDILKNYNLESDFLTNTINSIALDTSDKENDSSDSKINDLMEQMEFFEKMQFILEAIDEHYDGSGKKGLKGKDIPIDARIISICDFFVNLIEEKEYRKSLNNNTVMKYLFEDSGQKYDNALIESFAEFIKDKKDMATFLKIKV